MSKSYTWVLIVVIVVVVMSPLSSTLVSAVLSLLGVGEIEHFSEVEVGQTFFLNRDGYHLKLPNNYCLGVLLGSTARLFKVPEELLDVPFSGDNNHPEVYNTPCILEGHYIKGYYNEKFVILCEEKEDGTLEYLSFDFYSEKIEYYTDIDKVYEIYGFDSNDWSLVCNTNEEISH